jgi:tetratricopeptide (TPR) repeat protein
LPSSCCGPDYDRAVGHYTLAIGSVRAEIFETPNKGKLKLLLASYYTSRAASLTKLKQYDEALEDCESAIKFDRNAIKPYQRRARLYMQRGMLDEAMETYDQGIKLDASAMASDRKHTETTKKKFEGAKAIIEQQRNEKLGEKAAAVEKAKEELKTILRFCPDWDEARILEAEALFYTKEYEGAYQLASSLVKNGLSKDRNLLVLRVHLMLNKGNLDDAVKQLWVISRRNSDCGRSATLNEKVELIRQLRDQAEESYKNKDYERAARYCTTAIDSCPETADGMVAKLKFSRSAAYASMGSHFRAIDDYTDVLQYNPSHLKAYTRRGSSYMAAKTGNRLKNCQLAVESFEQALELCTPSTSTEENVHQKLEEAQKELRKVKMTSKDYFAVLGVPKSANLAAIYNAYRMSSLRIHNFKHSASTQREVDEAEFHHQELSDAYEVLSEAFKNGTINEFSHPTPSQRPGNKARRAHHNSEPNGTGGYGGLVPRQRDYKGKEVRGQEGDDRVVLTKKPSLRGTFMSASQA